MFTPSFFTNLHSGSSSEYAIAASTTPVKLLSGSAYGRRGATIFNHSNASLYLSTKQSASAASFYVKITSGSFYDMEKPVYDGEIWGAWDSANGFAMILDKHSPE